jgi:quinol monooxygenase YgiN
MNWETKGDLHMILASIRMTIAPQKFGEALGILKSLVAECTVQPGCLNCRIYRNVQSNNVLMFQQLWNDEANLQRHLRSDEYRQLLLVLEMATKQPEIRFDTILSSTGIETIEKARSNAE